jgi:hypothetical protein
MKCFEAGTGINDDALKQTRSASQPRGQILNRKLAKISHWELERISAH